MGHLSKGSCLRTRFICDPATLRCFLGGTFSFVKESDMPDDTTRPGASTSPQRGRFKENIRVKRIIKIQWPQELLLQSF